MVRRSALLALALVVGGSIVYTQVQAQDEAPATQPAAPAAEAPATDAHGPDDGHGHAAPAPAPAPAADAAAPSADAAGLETLEQKVAYAIGQNIGRQLKRQSIPLDPAILARGINEGMAGNSALTDEQMDAVMMEFQQKVSAQQTAQNKGEGDNYLAENAKKEGVTTTTSGLQYEVIKPGEGKAPTAEDTVTVHYTGTLLNGEVFDSSVQRGQPATFPLNGVIAGWTEGLQLMKEGAKYRFVIPPDLAYGEHGTPGGPIGPNQVLVFEVELIKVAEGGAE